MTDLVIIGGGPAGMSAAVAAYESGIRDIVILERDSSLEFYSNVYITDSGCINSAKS